jgi:hypothetical protein
MKTRFVIQITEPENHPHAGKYLKGFDPRGNDGRGTVYVTESLDEAKKFRTPERAERFYLQEAHDGTQALRFFSVRTLAVAKVPT